MKISTFVMLILIISGVFFTYAEIVREANQNFDEQYLNSSEWEENYDFIDDINETYYPIEQKLKKIQDEDEGWFSKLTEGITALPYAILIIPQSVFGSLVFGSKIIVSFLTAMSIPAKIVTLGLVMLLVWGVFKLIEFFNKTEF